ncbi:MAG: monovalent cation/H+ antiporter complex subunit F [Hyphomicrobiaceae bacterium]
MSEFLFGAAVVILAMTALGLARLLWGPGSADRLMSAQLLGTGGIAFLLLISVAGAMPSVVDVALTLSLLAAFVTIAFVKGSSSRSERHDRTETDP